MGAVTTVVDLAWEALGAGTRRVPRVPSPLSRPTALAAPPPGSGLRAVMGDPGLPLLGYTVHVFADGMAWAHERWARYGPVSWSSVFGTRLVTALGPDATQTVLANREKVFSNEHGWEYFIGPFFRRGIMLLDGEEHLHDRRIMQAAFSRERLGAYLAQMQPGLAAGIGAWQPGRLLAHPALKQLTLDLATTVFLGIALGPRADALTTAFVDTVRAGTGLVRRDVPLTRWRRGLEGRRVLEDFFRAELPGKRRAPGEDLFSALCVVEDEDGNRFSDDDIVSHMIFLLMAAHDTTTITLTTMLFQLAVHRDWQERVRAESQALPSDELTLAELDRLEQLDWVMKEALRSLPPVPSLPRRATRDTQLLGHHVPAGTLVHITPFFTHMMPELWTDPAAFDPLRFSPARREDRGHPSAWVPFGGGVHKCIGLHFAGVQVKAVMHRLLRRWRWSVPDGYQPRWDLTSLPRPADGLPVALEAIA